MYLMKFNSTTVQFSFIGSFIGSYLIPLSFPFLSFRFLPFHQTGKIEMLFYSALDLPKVIYSERTVLYGVGRPNHAYLTYMFKQTR